MLKTLLVCLVFEGRKEMCGLLDSGGGGGGGGDPGGMFVGMSQPALRFKVT